MIELIHKYMTWQYFDRVLIVLGFIVLSKYTYETYKLRKISKDQQDLQILPLPHLYISRTGNPSLEITNLGNGTAIDIKIKTVEFMREGKQKKFEFEVNYGNNILEYKGRKIVTIIFYDSGDKKGYKLSGEAFCMHFAANGKFMIDEGRTISITYQDIMAQTYELKQRFSKRGTFIVQLPKRVKQK